MKHLKHKSINEMNEQELRSEVNYLRSLLFKRLTFWQIFDRIFRWKIIQIVLDNPLHYNASQNKEIKDKCLKIIFLSDNGSFNLEEILDGVISAVNKSVFKTCGLKPSDFSINTGKGRFRIENFEG